MVTKLKYLPFESLVPTIVTADNVPVSGDPADPDTGEDFVAVIGAMHLQMIDSQGCYSPVIVNEGADPSTWVFRGAADYAYDASSACYASRADYADYAQYADCALYVEHAYCACYAECAGYAQCAGYADHANSANTSYRVGCLAEYPQSMSIRADCDGLYFEYIEYDDAGCEQRVSNLLQYGEVGSLPDGAKVLYFV